MNNFKLTSDVYLFADIFISKNTIAFVSMVYPHHPIDFNNINCYFQSKSYKFDKLKIHEGIASSVIGQLTHKDIQNHLKNNDTITFSIEYNFAKKDYTLIKPDKTKYGLTMITLFKGDGYLIDCWIDYYKELGVEHFYFYYNGPISNIGDLLPKYDKKYVTFIEWDYIYFMYKDNDIKKRYCCAQPMAINSCLYRFGPNTKWLGIFDLDEYIVCEKNNLPDLLRKFDRKEVANVYFLNSWANVENVNKRKLVLDDLKRNPIKRDNKLLNYPTRSKNIINPKNIINAGWHQMYKIEPGSKVVSSDTYFLHFFKFSSKERKQNLIVDPVDTQLLL